jgi:hypothetical protein
VEGSDKNLGAETTTGDSGQVGVVFKTRRQLSMGVWERNPELNRVHEFCLIKRNHGVLETELAVCDSSSGCH